VGGGIIIIKKNNFSLAPLGAGVAVFRGFALSETLLASAANQGHSRDNHH